ncbi:MAG: hypothetical protein U1A27_03440 [Phycisphaerae bacterium]
MRSMSGRDGRGLSWARRAAAAVLLFAALGAAGCSELVIEGNIIDRDTARPIPDVAIDLQQGGGWKRLGETDQRGRYWILRHTVKSGYVRLSKVAYYQQVISDSEFRSAQGFQLVPGSSSDDSTWSTTPQ